MTVKLLTKHHLDFLSLKVDCTGSYESTLVKMPHCWKSHVTAQIPFFFLKEWYVACEIECSGIRVSPVFTHVR